MKGIVQNNPDDETVQCCIGTGNVKENECIYRDDLRTEIGWGSNINCSATKEGIIKRASSSIFCFMHLQDDYD